MPQLLKVSSETEFRLTILNCSQEAGDGWL